MGGDVSIMAVQVFMINGQGVHSQIISAHLVATGYTLYSPCALYTVYTAVY
jgi:hypothetical protein